MADDSAQFWRGRGFVPGLILGAVLGAGAVAMLHKPRDGAGQELLGVPSAVLNFEDDSDATRTGEAFLVDGVLGKAIRLDGRSGYATVADGPALRSSTITLAAWFKLTTVPVEHGVTVLCKPQRPAPWTHPYLSWMIRINTATIIEAAIGASGSYGGVFHPASPLTAGAWHHVALTYDGSELRAYLDGALMGTDASVHGPIDYGPFPMLIGADFGASPVADHFPGEIDQVAVWSRPLTAAAVRRLYNDGKGVVLP